MRPTISIKHSMDKLASHGGLINIGALLNSLDLKTSLNNLDGIHCIDHKFAHSDIIFSMRKIGKIGTTKLRYFFDM